MILSALIFGLLGSFHCIGMCGPIAFMLPVDRSNKIKQFFQILSYHFGRLFTYGLIGLLFGLLGKGFLFLRISAATFNSGRYFNDFGNSFTKKRFKNIIFQNRLING